MPTRFCAFCGTPRVEGGTFCENCGRAAGSGAAGSSADGSSADGWGTAGSPADVPPASSSYEAPSAVAAAPTPLLPSLPRARVTGTAALIHEGCLAMLANGNEVQKVFWGFFIAGVVASFMLSDPSLKLFAMAVCWCPPLLIGRWRHQQHTRDIEGAKCFAGDLEPIVSNPPPTDVSVPGTQVLTSPRLAEVSKHFDSNTNASITGWMDHNLGFHGWGAGVGVGGVGLGVGRLGLSGHSDVNLTMDATTRDNMLSDGFIAVLEIGSGASVQPIRLVVPGDPAARGTVASLILAATRAYGGREGSHRTRTLENLAAAVRSAPLGDISYCSDRLSAILRLPPAQRPALSITGVSLGRHVVLGCAIRFGNEATEYQLFPLAMTLAIRAALEGNLAQAPRLVGAQAS